MVVPEEVPLLEVRGIGKRYPGVVALDDVALTVRGGEVVAVIGENGAGKSTLMSILAGVQRPDRGEVWWDGHAVHIDSVHDAIELGIALIHQELNLCDNLSAGANVFLGREPHERFGRIGPRAIDRAARPFLERVGLDVSPSTPVGKLAIGQRQLVEIAKALSQDANLLIMDEPTSSLSFDETEKLYAVIGDLRRSGVAIVYITHRLAEVEAVADRVVGLRDGKNSGELLRHQIDHLAMVRLMVGRDLEVRPRRRPTSFGDVRLQVAELATTAWPAEAIDLEVRGGEIVGLAGLVGSGRTELLETIFGARHRLRGQVEVDGVSLRSGDLRAAVRAGVALVPEDRKECGLVLEMTVRHNLSLASLPEHRAGRLRGRGFVDFGRERQTAERACQQLGVRSSGPRECVRNLSGGNQQKVVLGKWLVREPGVLLLDEPTRGVDIAAKDEIYQEMEQLAESGMAILFASSEMAELLGLADRIVVVHEGRIEGELPAPDATEEQVMALATGAALEVTP